MLSLSALKPLEAVLRQSRPGWAHSLTVLLAVPRRGSQQFFQLARVDVRTGWKWLDTPLSTSVTATSYAQPTFQTSAVLQMQISVVQEPRRQSQLANRCSQLALSPGLPLSTRTLKNASFGQKPSQTIKLKIDRIDTQASRGMFGIWLVNDEGWPSPPESPTEKQLQWLSHTIFLPTKYSHAEQIFASHGSELRWGTTDHSKGFAS